MAEQRIAARIAPVPRGAKSELVTPQDYAELKGEWNGTVDIRYIKLPQAQQKTSYMLNNPPRSFPGAAEVHEVVSPKKPAIRIFHVRDYHGVTEANAVRVEMAARSAKVLSPELRQEAMGKI